MSVREYIGARYVPVFADPIQWESTLSYEPLTVVTDNGTSYVSRQSVPPGTAIDNESYWVRWADYNAQLEEYIRQVQTYSASIDALNDALPIADFDDDATVKDAIDGLGALLPATDFASDATVKAAIDGAVALLPGTDFDSVNTVKAAIDALELSTNAAIDGVRTVYNVKDYGAVGDGVTDDTQAFKDCITAASAKTGTYIYIPTNAGEMYRITDTLSIENSFTTVYSNAQYSLNWANSGIIFEPASISSVLFKVNASGCRFENLMLSTNREYNDYRGIAIECGINDAPDTDIKINGCLFIHFETAVKHYDRGLRFFDNLVVECTTGVELHTLNLTNLNNNAMRAIALCNNRIHQMTYFVKCVNSKPVGMMICNNYIDAPPAIDSRSLTMLYADSDSEFWGGVISGNSIADCHGYCIEILGEAYNLSIVGNNWHNRRGANIEGFIYIGTLHACNISNNAMQACAKDAIKLNAVSQSLISDNRFGYVGTSASGSAHYAAIAILSSIAQTLIDSNMMHLNSATDCRCIRYDGTSTISIVRITNNFSARSEIFTNVNSAATSNVKIQANNTD